MHFLLKYHLMISNTSHLQGRGRHGHMVVGFTTICAIYITTNVASSNPVHDEVYSIKFVSDLRQAGGFLHQQNWPPWYNWNIVERDIQHHKTKPSIYRWPNTENLNKMSSKWPPCSHIDFSRKYIVCISPSLNTTSLQIISSWSQTIFKVQVDHTKTSIWLPFNHLELLISISTNLQ